MKYLTMLAMASILTAANPLVPRQGAQPAADVLTLRANFCIDPDKAGCEEAIGKCQDESKVIEDCIRDEHPSCIKDEASSCSKAVSKCLADFGKETDADQAVKDCIVEKVISGWTPKDDETKQPTEAGEEQAGPRGSASAEQVNACKKASAEYELAMLKNGCNEIIDPEYKAPETDPPACETAGAVFEEAWAANNCEAAFGGEE